uniref:non-specific serine/threonine protein kinase n=1 Tax=Meloidogyne floridensis TaxID=298350 RepID=A0A915P7D7_9BILA
MHSAGLIHGDLTTSNVLVKKKQDDNLNLIFIDLGLSQFSQKPEAVDLYVLERAIKSAHIGMELRELGSIIQDMHAAGLIHDDLTTSNVLVKQVCY